MKTERRGCKTPGAIYSFHITCDGVSMSVTLPPKLWLMGLTKADATRIEDALHDAGESILGEILAAAL
jgi:hypothetical protein